MAAIILLGGAVAYLVGALRDRRSSDAVARATEYGALATAAHYGDAGALAELRRRGLAS